VVAIFLVAAAVIIASQSVREIRTPHHAPEWYTLVVLCAVIAIKELMFRRVIQIGSALNSRSLTADAWHHRSDAITSAAAFVGISIALAGGEGYESADDWAALAACVVIAYNGLRILRPAVDEVMDRAVPDDVVEEVRQIASSVEGVRGIEKCRVRKSGLGLLMDIHVLVDGDSTVRDGHAIGHDVKDRLSVSRLGILDIVVHIEPAENRTRDS
jgi:cation diffusion facilitator family transporter